PFCRGRVDSCTIQPETCMSADAATENEKPDDFALADDPEAARHRYLLERFWTSARGFWGRDGKRIAWILTVGLIVLVILELGVSYGINRWNRLFFDALDNCDADTARAQGLNFPVLAAVSVAL